MGTALLLGEEQRQSSGWIRAFQGRVRGRTVELLSRGRCPTWIPVEVPDLDAPGDRVRYAAWPRRPQGTESFARSVSVWCAKDPHQAMTDAKAGRMGDWITVNGDGAWRRASSRQERLRLRLFRAIAPDGITGPLRDTLLVDREETVEIAFVADNPGDWLLHCHMPEHSVAGMKTWLRVA